MSQVLYDSLLEKWRDFLSSKQYIVYDSLITEVDVQNLYDDFVDEFCKENNYSEGTKELVFFAHWWDTFKDEFYKSLDKRDMRIIHKSPMEGDWDYGKKFEFEKGSWKTVDQGGNLK